MFFSLTCERLSQACFLVRFSHCACVKISPQSLIREIQKSFNLATSQMSWNVFEKIANRMWNAKKNIAAVNMFQGLWVFMRCARKKITENDNNINKFCRLRKVLKLCSHFQKKSICSLTLTLRNVVLVRVYTRPTQHARKFAPPFLRAKNTQSLWKSL